MSESAINASYLPEEHAPDPLFSHGDPTPPGKVGIWLFLASEIMFFAARIYARLGQPREASDWLLKALAKGYSKADIRSCPDLDGLMSEPAVRRAMAL